MEMRRGDDLPDEYYDQQRRTVPLAGDCVNRQNSVGCFGLDLRSACARGPFEDSSAEDSLSIKQKLWAMMFKLRAWSKERLRLVLPEIRELRV